MKSRTRLSQAIARAAVLTLCANTACIMPAHAQGTSSQSKDYDASILMLGTAGGPILRTSRSQPATLWESGDQKILIDSGYGTVNRMVISGIRPAQINALFITHLHPDHTMDLTSLIANRYFQQSVGGGSATAFRVYGPVGTTKLVRAATNYVQSTFEAFAAQGLIKPFSEELVEAYEVAPNSKIAIGDIEVKAHSNTHYSTFKPAENNDVVSLSYRFRRPGADVTFTGDTGPDDKLAAFAKDTDVLVTEVIDIPRITVVITNILSQNGKVPLDTAQLNDTIDHMKFEHLSLPEAGKLATSATPGLLLFHHFGPETDGLPTDEWLKDFDKHYRGRSIASKDGTKVCIRNSKAELC